jgi:acetyl esterase/lipase
MKIGLNGLCGLALAAMVMMHGAAAQATTATLPLWQGTPPKSLGTAEKDIPTLTVYLPEKAGDKLLPAILVCPGGGYAHLALEHEGSAIGKWCNSIGVAAFVLKYRLPGDGYRHPVPMLDAQHALSTIRARAAQWHVDPQKIGVMGFSAGGHLASTLATHYHRGIADAKDPIDRVSCRPDFAVLVYPVITLKALTHGGSRNNLLGPNPPAELIENLSNETQVTPDTPPTFLVHTTQDKTVPVENSIDFYLACRKAGVPAELHIFEAGAHGFGIKPVQTTVAGKTWMNRLADWLRARGIVGDAKKKQA